MTDQAQAQAEVQSQDQTEAQDGPPPTPDNSTIIFRLVLTSGIVLEIGEPWPGPDGDPDEAAEYTTTDESGAEKKGHLKIGAIFLRPEETETSEDSDDDGVVAHTAMVGEHYEVWSEPCSPKMRMFRVRASNVVYDESSVPYKFASDVVQERLVESVVDFPDETPAGDGDQAEPQNTPSLSSSLSQTSPTASAE